MILNYVCLFSKSARDIIYAHYRSIMRLMYSLLFTNVYWNLHSLCTLFFLCVCHFFLSQAFWANNFLSGFCLLLPPSFSSFFPSLSLSSFSETTLSISKHFEFLRCELSGLPFALKQLCAHGFAYLSHMIVFHQNFMHLRNNKQHGV